MSEKRVKKRRKVEREVENDSDHSPKGPEEAGGTDGTSTARPTATGEESPEARLRAALSSTPVYYTGDRAQSERLVRLHILRPLRAHKLQQKRKRLEKKRRTSKGEERKEEGTQPSPGRMALGVMGNTRRWQGGPTSERYSVVLLSLYTGKCVLLLHIMHFGGKLGPRLTRVLTDPKVVKMGFFMSRVAPCLRAEFGVCMDGMFDSTKLLSPLELKGVFNPPKFDLMAVAQKLFRVSLPVPHGLGSYKEETLSAEQKQHCAMRAVLAKLVFEELRRRFAASLEPGCDGAFPLKSLSE
eukprot:RCo035247